jgi:hypothetical protein
VENDRFVDFYDMLMISPSADRHMVEWATRLMLARYDPQKSKNPDPQKYQLVRDAYRTLADPARRAEYDTELAKQKEPTGQAELSREPSEDGAEDLVRPKSGAAVAANGSISQQTFAELKRRRHAVVSLLYKQMVTSPRDPGVGRTEIGRMSDLDVDELEFTLWFLREMGLVKATQAGSYTITVAGAQWIEEAGRNSSSSASEVATSFQAGLGALGEGVGLNHTNGHAKTPESAKPAALPPSSETRVASVPAELPSALPLRH